MSDKFRAELEGHLKAWGRAIVANDADEISGFATEDWVLVTSEGGPIDSSMFLGAVRSGALTHDTFEVEVQRVLDYGEVAIAIAHVTNSGTYQGTPFTADEWTTDVFVRSDRRWICVLTALTPRSEAS